MSREPALNPSSIAALRNVSPGDRGAFLRELCSIFIADTPPRLAELERLFAAGDLEALSRVAHSIKGASGNFGADRLAGLAKQIELDARAGDAEAVRRQIPLLRTAYEEVQAEMHELYAR